MEPSALLCPKCQLISSEFILSKDFRDFSSISTARTTPVSWTCRQDDQGKHYRDILYHDMDGLHEASRKGCKICSFFLGLLNRFSVNGQFPILHGQFRITISETGGLELVPPSAWTWGDLTLGWQEVLPSEMDQRGTSRAGQMRKIARMCWQGQEYSRPETNST